MIQVQDRMQAFLESLVSNGSERGMQLTVFLGGKCVVDVAAGFADVGGQREVKSDTLFPVFSCTKGIATTVIHQLVERGRLTYDTPVADVWPEFAAHGKRGILLRYVLDHTSGMHLMPLGLNRATLSDWDATCAAIAASAAATPPGAARVYHAVSHGFLLGEIARRVDGRPFCRQVADEIAKPLGTDELFVGLPPSHDARVAELSEVFEPGKEPQTTGDDVAKSIPNWMFPLHDWMNQADARRACVPASNGIMSARALAAHYAALLPGGLNGVELLPGERVRFATHYKSPDCLDETPAAWGLGYAIGKEGSEMGPRPTSFGHGGYGGSIGFADIENRLAVGFTKNHFSAKGATVRILDQLRSVLGITAAPQTI